MTTLICMPCSFNAAGNTGSCDIYIAEALMNILLDNRYAIYYIIYYEFENYCEVDID